MSAPVSPVRPVSAERSNGRRVVPAGGLRRISGRLPLAGMALLCVLVGILIVAWWTSSASTKSAVLVAARSIAVGEVIEPADLRIVEIVADEGVSTVPAGKQRDVIGQRAAVGIPAGVLLSPQALRGGPRLQVGESIVAVPVPVGAAPVPDLSVGDRLAVVSTAGSSGVLTTGEAVAITEVDGGPSSTSGLSVSLLVPTARAAAVAAAAANDGVRLVLVAPDEDLGRSSTG